MVLHQMFKNKVFWTICILAAVQMMDVYHSTDACRVVHHRHVQLPKKAHSAFFFTFISLNLTRSKIQAGLFDQQDLLELERPFSWKFSTSYIRFPLTHMLSTFIWPSAVDAMLLVHNTLMLTKYAACSAIITTSCVSYSARSGHGSLE